MVQIDDKTSFVSTIMATSENSFMNILNFTSGEERRNIETALSYDGKYYSIIFIDSDTGA